MKAAPLDLPLVTEQAIPEGPNSLSTPVRASAPGPTTVGVRFFTKLTKFTHPYRTFNRP